MSLLLTENVQGIRDFDTLGIRLQNIQDLLNRRLEAQVSPGIITYAGTTVSATYQQAEVQEIADNLELVNAKLTELITKLTAAGILE